MKSMHFAPDELVDYALKEGDILLAEASGSPDHVGRSAVWADPGFVACFQNTVIRFRPHLATSGYAHAVFRYLAAEGVFARTARGVGIQHLGLQRFRSLPFPLPPLPEQRRIEDELERRLSHLRAARAALASALSRIDEDVQETLAAMSSGELIGAGQSHQQLAKGWRAVRIGELGTSIVGKQLTPRTRTGSAMKPYLRVANVLEGSIDLSSLKEMDFSSPSDESYRLHPGDILLNEGQSAELVGRSAVVPDDLGDIRFQNTLIRFRPSEDVIPAFAHLVFRHFLRDGTFSRIARRSTNIAHLGLSRFRQIEMRLPPLAQQRALVRKAHRRLDAANERRLLATVAQSNTSSVEHELLRAAVRGQLVPQYPGDGSASDLLIRMGGPKEETRVRRKKARPMDRQEKGPSALEAVVRAADGPMPLADLFREAGYDPNSTTDIEEFYVELREALLKRLRQVGEGEGARVEVRPDAT